MIGGGTVRLGAAVAAVLLMSTLPALAGPFSNLGGRWVGSGKIVYADGKSEALSCRVTYFIADEGTSVKQNIRCSGPGSQFAVSSDLKSKDNKVTGTWNETIQNASGTVDGTVNAGAVTVGLSGSITGSMLVNTSGSSQTVSIDPKSDLVDRISLSLRKG